MNPVDSLRSPERLDVLAIAGLAGDFTVLHDRLTAQDRADRHACHFPAVVRRPTDFRKGRVVGDDLFLVHIDDHHVGVGARQQNALFRINVEDLCRIVRGYPDQGIER